MPRLLVTPAAAANRKATSTPAVEIDSIDISGIDRLHNTAKLLPEIGTYQVLAPADITAPFRVQDQVASRVDVFVVLKAAISVHPHELAAARSDSTLQRLPVRRLKFHCGTLLSGAATVRCFTRLHKPPLFSPEWDIREPRGSSP